MSANNYLRISKSDFTVKECDADVIDIDKGVIIAQGKDLIDAIVKAEEYMQENIVEYGITFGK